ncbi:MAG: uracil phosphoribosyltransferase [Sulfurovaceae bacterium]|nr:uracil phosphoribosyltransferase [Sulfurovaceae bacterium]
MIHELSNIVAKNLINHLREQKIDSFYFRHIIKELSRFLAYEALSSLEPKTLSIETRTGKISFDFLDEENLVFVAILRAGLPMIEAMSDLFPKASFGFLAMKRDEETHKSKLYYDRVPLCKNKIVIVVDPMVATGGSLSDAIDFIKTKAPKKIFSLNLIGCPQGLAVIEKKHPDIKLYIAQIDKKLDSNMFILPGIGDAGDREYNTPQ